MVTTRGRGCLLIAATVLAMLACSSGEPTADDAGMSTVDAGGVEVDAGVDSGRAPDAGSTLDGGSPDSGVADAATTGLFVEVGGVVSMETEHHNNNTGGWELGLHAEASGGEFMRSVSARTATDRVEFHVRFERTGWYRVWIRSTSTSDGDNDCYVLLDGALGSLMTDTGWVEVSGIKTNNRTWGGWDSQAKSETDIPLDIRRRGTHVQVTSPGEYVFALGSRSLGFQIDKVVLVSMADSFVPSGLGPPETRE